jgi:hypothetical protein
VKQYEMVSRSNHSATGIWLRSLLTSQHTVARTGEERYAVLVIQIKENTK